jgi:serine/threonine protein phosphatase 1
MSKWRPTTLNTNEKYSCIFVIPDVHGRLHELSIVLDRILPLRNDKNAKDLLVFLGDYCDRGPDTPGVFDLLIKLKEKYKDQIVFLKGNHEELMLQSCGGGKGWDPMLPSAFSMWLNNGGNFSIIQYAKRKGVEVKDAKTLSSFRAVSFIEKEHLDFMNETLSYYELDDYIFVHAGCDPNISLKDQDDDILLWDRSLYETVKKIVGMGQECPWEKTIITGHNYNGVFINKKFMMLDGSAHDKLFVLELNSMECFFAGFGKDRLVKFPLEETKVKKSVVRRVDE